MAQKKTAAKTGAKTAAKKQTSKKNGNSSKKTAAKNNNKTNTSKQTNQNNQTPKAEPKKQLSPAAVEALCIIAAGFSALIIFSIFFASESMFGRIVLEVLKGLFGTGAYILPFGVILAVIGFFMTKDRGKIRYKAVLCWLLFCVLISLLHILLYDADNGFSAEAILGGFTDTDYTGGGLIGGFFGGGSLVMFKKTGSVIIFLTLTAALIVLISGKSIFRIFSGIGRFFTETLMGGMYSKKYADEYDDYDDYEDYEGYDDGYEEYEEYEESEPKKKAASRQKKQKSAPAVQNDEDYYEKLRREKSYKDAKFINLKENKDDGERKERPDLMPKRVKKGAYTGEDLSNYKLPPVEKEPSALPSFLKNEKQSRRNGGSEYVPEFLRSKNKGRASEAEYEEYDNSEELYDEELYNEELYEEEEEIGEASAYEEPKAPDIVINSRGHSFIDIEPVEPTEPDNEAFNGDYVEDEVSEQQNEAFKEKTEASGDFEEDYKEEQKEEREGRKDRKDIEEKPPSDIPPWESPGEAYKATSKENVKVIEADAATVNRIQAKKADYSFPKLSFLNKNPDLLKTDNREELVKNSHILEDTLRSFKVEATVVEVSQGPTVTRYELVPAVGTKVRSIANLDRDLAMRLAAKNIIIEAPIPGKTAVGIEIPNENPFVVYFSEIVASKKFQASKSNLTFGLGKDVAGNVIVRDIAKAPHFLIAGATNSGKSVCINTLINCLLYKATPDEIRLIMVDPKMVELNVYNGIPHLLIPVVTDPHKASAALNWACTEMMRRYKLCADVGVRNLDEYNDYLRKEGETPLYKIVIIIDELADLMLVAKKEVEGHIQRLTQLARAAGIHLIVATQRPSSDVITGVIKSNIPSRIAFSVAQAINSRIILDESGAEKLIGKGDMLLKTVEMERSLRVQGAFISNEEIKKIVDHIKTDEPNYDRAIMESIENPESMEEADISGGHSPKKGSDELINDVIAYVVKSKKASTSLVQRQFQIGYNRAARIIDELEERGIVGPENGSKPRAVFMDREEWQEYSQRQRDYI